MTTDDTQGVLGSFFGDEAFPVEWNEGERDLFWIFDDLHIPNPVSPMFFDIGGWWLTCDHMFRRFGTPFASDWIAKNVLPPVGCRCYTIVTCTLLSMMPVAMA